MGKGRSSPLGWPVRQKLIQRVLRRLGSFSRCLPSTRSRGRRHRRSLWSLRSRARGSRRSPIRRRIVLGRRRRVLHQRIGQICHTHHRGLRLLPKLEAEVPHPLVDDLPELLAPLGPRYPAVGSLFLIFVSKRRLERATMQIQIQHIRRRKRWGGKGCDKLLVDGSLSHGANRRA